MIKEKGKNVENVYFYWAKIRECFKVNELEKAGLLFRRAQ